MNSFAIVFLIINAIALIVLPRRWASLPLLIGACYMTAAQRLEIGPFSFTVLRLLILAGAIRVVAKRERLPGGMIGLDVCILFWGVWLVCASLFHASPTESLVLHLGACYNTLGIYFLVRIFCQSREDLAQLIKITAIILLPVAIEMVIAKLTGHNFFSLFGGVPEEVVNRNGRLRAQGPFAHPILAGTVGAICIPFMISIWQLNKIVSKIGLLACITMVIASTSSGPFMSVFFGLLGLALWPWRAHLGKFRVIAILAYLIMELFASRPAYYAILNRIDLTGSSTGWHRAELISSSLEHFDEWWFAGTDYTRHWMPTGVSWSPDHADITNHYLYYAIWGGLPLLSLFIFALWLGFRYVGHSLRYSDDPNQSTGRFFEWSLGATLFAQTATCIAVAYFDQSVMFLYLNLAAIGSLHATSKVALNTRNTYDESDGNSDFGQSSTPAHIEPTGVHSDIQKYRTS